MDNFPLEKFDDLFVGDPIEIERNLGALLPRAEGDEDRSLYPQILSQMALAQAMQKRFEEAHRTLDNAEDLEGATLPRARARLLIERGRIFWQAGDPGRGRSLFEKAFALSREHELHEHAVNAAHLIAIVSEDPEEKITWNLQALDLATQSDQMRAQAWLGSLYHNLGHAYLETKAYEKGLEAFQRAVAFRESEGLAINVAAAKWGVARALRFLGRCDEALPYLDPTVEVPALRGLIYEELSEIYAAKSASYAQLAQSDLSQDEWFQKLHPERLKRLQELTLFPPSC